MIDWWIEGYVGSSATRAALAVVQGATRITEVMEMTGWTSKATAHRALTLARQAGLVDWTDRAQGTLHPTVKVVSNGVGRSPRAKRPR